MFWDKKQLERPVDPLLEEARSNLPHFTSLRDHPGWGLVKGLCVGAANEAIKEWTGGATQERQLALASKVSTLAWFVDLIDNQVAVCRNILSASGEGPEVGEDDGSTPFTDPFEPVESI